LGICTIFDEDGRRFAANFLPTCLAMRAERRK